MASFKPDEERISWDARKLAQHSSLSNEKEEKHSLQISLSFFSCFPSFHFPLSSFHHTLNLFFFSFLFFIGKHISYWLAKTHVTISLLAKKKLLNSKSQSHVEEKEPSNKGRIKSWANPTPRIEKVPIYPSIYAFFEYNPCDSVYPSSNEK